jgi:hypothetical protein
MIWVEARAALMRKASVPGDGKEDRKVVGFNVH